jgi:cephalosporin hydroxylase
MWMDYADTIVVIDDMMRDSDNWRSWADDTLVDLTLLQGDCAHPEIVKAAREHSPYDLVFLDADHTYEAGTQHWNIYRHMVESGGMFAFHDIRPYEHGQLDRLWAEIKREPGARTAEFHHFEADWGGIGVVWM